MRFLIYECGASKFLWATDTPLPTDLLPTDQYVKVFTERQTDVPFSDEEIELMMWKNNAEVFGI